MLKKLMSGERDADADAPVVAGPAGLVGTGTVAGFGALGRDGEDPHPTAMGGL